MTIPRRQFFAALAGIPVVSAFQSPQSSMVARMYAVARIQPRLINTYMPDGLTMRSLDYDPARDGAGFKLTDQYVMKIGARVQSDFLKMLEDQETLELFLRAEKDRSGSYLPALSVRIAQSNPAWIDNVYSRERFQALVNIVLDDFTAGLKLDEAIRKKAFELNIAEYHKVRLLWQAIDMAVATGADDKVINAASQYFFQIIFNNIIKAKNPVGQTIIRLSPLHLQNVPAFNQPVPVERPQDLSLRMAGRFLNAAMPLNPNFLGMKSTPENFSRLRVANFKAYQQSCFSLYKDSPDIAALLVTAEKNPQTDMENLAKSIRQKNPMVVVDMYSSLKISGIVNNFVRLQRYHPSASVLIQKFIAGDIENARLVVLQQDLTLALSDDEGKTQSALKKMDVYFRSAAQKALAPYVRREELQP